MPCYYKNKGSIASWGNRMWFQECQESYATCSSVTTCQIATTGNIKLWTFTYLLSTFNNHQYVFNWLRFINNIICGCFAPAHSSLKSLGTELVTWGGISCGASSLFCGSVTAQLMVIGERETFSWESNYWHPTQWILLNQTRFKQQSCVAYNLTGMIFSNGHVLQTYYSWLGYYWVPKIKRASTTPHLK